MSIDHKQQRIENLTKRINDINRTIQWVLSLPPSKEKHQALITLGFEHGWLDSELICATRN